MSSHAASMADYARRERLRHIDVVVRHYGAISRHYLTDYYGMGPATATRDIKAYLDISGGNIKYDYTSRTYVKSDNYTPLF